MYLKIRRFTAPIYLSCVLLFFACSGQAYGQDTTKLKKWHFLAEPYLMFPYMDGETGIGESLLLPVDATAGDIFSKLQMGAMLYFEAKTDQYAITSDIVYMNLEQAVSATKLVNSGTVDAKQFIWEFAGLYRLSSFLEIGIGGRLNYLQMGVDAQVNTIPAGTEQVVGRQSKTWFDPIIITRFTTDINNKWLFQVRGDLGGFNIGSVYTWQLQAYVGYRFTNVFQLSVGYRTLSTKYLDGDEPKEFIFNVKEFGPLIRLGFNF